MENSPFAKLSTEVRYMIYEYTLPDPLDTLKSAKYPVKPKVNITQLCSQMREAHRASTTPYLLSLAGPDTLLCMNGCCAGFPSKFREVLARGAAAFQRLPFLFHSKPTTIDIPMRLCTAAGRDSSFHEGYEKWSEWKQTRDTVRSLIQETPP
jgi:hypothetical protein